ncbi:MAG: conjugative transposon protein TraN [Winogradskyella sp.]|jgi:conjugative transposon TraN protein|uniref:Bacteroides conjugative transposon TraN protein n=6 Tax=Bacteria TaxID=2 RepID=A0A4U8WBE5_9FLAO|nr:MULTISPECIES: conjugative transposon protein TraN [Bacteroidota]MBL85242.1 conjugative transposon protein TraN [Winogradskyella sp.]MBN8879683.1 conjugative transposon protein TraN [Sphingobacteriales bacterium]MCT3673427.1 conjugative transposon protein TraN [Elizabethkingia anophelis]MXS70306.1 conjugative transposon protein TraN [Flavobacteriaceae bacterium W22]ODS91852.1 MAG: conjugative transposon protein TraN [Chryseobacterium sp. SCN 40-13]RPG27966.1 MAG: conjugative transposon prot|tara:strand:- start:7982 stop:8875 length:894 start_codon:yes stop_codon:yes gene_type:complete
MKNHLKTFWAFALILGFAVQSYAQDSAKTPLALGKIEPYRMEVTYDKTSHLIFPTAIRYVDLGSEYLIAGKAEDAENVLRVKASVREFEAETNFSVITNDGRFYSFNVYYSPYPEALSYDLLTMQKAVDKANGNDVLFEELGNNSPSLAGLLLETIYKKDKRIVKHIGAKSFGIQFILKGIYIHNGKYYFHTELRNRTNVPFQIDFVNFKVVDKKVAKRTVVQERPMIPLRTYKPLDEIGGKTTEQNVFLLDQFTIADDKVLLIEIFEKNGGRHQTLQIENSDLIKARLINDMHLKF